MAYKIGSLFDGSGGFPLAASLCGGTPVWASEVEPYPIAVTKSRFPNMKHLGSVTDVKGNEVEPVDVITFGSPCQDLFVAGKRAGLKHEDNGDEETTRSGLFMEAVRIIKEMREATNGVYPRFAVWENVPGAFSSNKGEDFRTVCEELIKIVEPGATMPAVPKNGWPYADCYCGDGWSLAYRVFDAQYWGVPQRRRRIYLVADFGGECAGEVSFEREGVRGYFEAGRSPWQGTEADAERGSGAYDRDGKSCGLTICEQILSLQGNTIDRDAKQNGCGVCENVSHTLNAVDRHGVCYSIQGNMLGRADKNGPQGDGVNENVSFTLNTTDRHAVAFQSYQKVTGPLMANSHPGSYCGQDAHSDMLVAGIDCRNMNEYPELYPTLQAKPNGGQSLNFSGAVRIRYIVRRLTPTECARLQGFADAWAVLDSKKNLTDEEYAFWCKVNLDYDRVFEKARPNEDGWYNVWREIKPSKAKGEDFEPYWEDTGKPYTHKTLDQMLKWYNKLHTDSSEYKLWGNGIALPCALYVMQGIAYVLDQQERRS